MRRGATTARRILRCVIGLTSAVASGCLAREAHPADPGPLAAASFLERTDLRELSPAGPVLRARREAAEPADGADGTGVARPPLETRTIDLTEALALGAAQSLQVALAREDVAAAHARLDQAEVAWLPDLRVGAEYKAHEGAIQDTGGSILQVHRSSGFVGGGLLAALDLTDAMLGPRSARYDVDAAIAGMTASANDSLLDVALAYNELLASQAGLALAEENVALAEDLVGLAEAFSRSGQGLEADAARARNELAQRRRAVVAGAQAIEARSARLATLLRIDPRTPLRAAEPSLDPFALVPADIGLDELVETALSSRPELRALTAGVTADEERERQERLRPFLPRVELGLRGGGLGGGTGSDFDALDGTGDVTATLSWGVRNLGLGESSARRTVETRTRRARIQLQMARDAVAEQVTTAYLDARSGRLQVSLAAQTVREASDSLELNMRRIRGAEGLPIEALQAIQSAAAARESYLAAVLELNRSQLLLLRAVGRPPGG